VLGVTFLVLLAAIVSRFPGFAGALPEWVSTAFIAIVGGLLLVIGLVERTTPRGTVGPIWMRLPRLLGLNLAAGFSFFTTLFTQTLGLSLGPVDPTLTNAPPASAALWFFVFTIGFLGIGMMSAPGLMVPLLRVLTAPLSKLTSPIGFVAAFGVGALFALALVVGASSGPVAELIARVRAFFDANTQLATLVLVALAVAPQLLGLGGGEPPARAPAENDEPPDQ